MSTAKWEGSKPVNCESCGCKFGKVFYDAYSPALGTWGKLCHNCFKDHGCRLGTGAGQKYDTKTLLKIAG